ncbi:trypco2 family protein [uncultured Bacteroides sp.]|uniref:trypco2 family protein n=1 Tax=uncultured Bacteroides sp. TaxID=162156 RepID=UPI002AAB26FC|nr:trypco2 family protein [uncultured Bacteroides sp.]
MEEKVNNVADKLFIAELIRRVHDELIRSQEIRESEGKAPLFTVNDLTIEVNFVAVEASSKKGGLDFKIITAGAKKEYNTQETHKVTLNLVVNNDFTNETKPIQEDQTKSENKIGGGGGGGKITKFVKVYPKPK